MPARTPGMRWPMDISGSRIAVAGATGALGGLILRDLHGRGARVALLGRDGDALGRVAADLGSDPPTATFDARDPASCRAAVEAAAEALGGLDGLVIATGAVAFGAGDVLEDDVAAELMAVNVLGPIALIRAALDRFEDGGLIAALSAIVADHPTAGMAAYSASKAALSAYLAALRREVRRDGVTVVDVRPPHLDTDFSEHPLAGTAPELPDAHSAAALAGEVVDAIAAAKREIAWDLKERRLVVR